MSANDILDVLNIQRDDAAAPAKKKQKTEAPVLQKGGLARELYNLLGPNTPPALLNNGLSRPRDRKLKVLPWTKMPFTPGKTRKAAPTLRHWEKGSRELLEASEKPYFFDKFNVAIDIPELCSETEYERFMAEIKETEDELARRKEEDEREAKVKKEESLDVASEESTKTKDAKGETPKAKDAAATGTAEAAKKSAVEPAKKAVAKDDSKLARSSDQPAQPAPAKQPEPWSYAETQLLFQLCKDYELKWYIIADRYPSNPGRSMEELKEQFYRVCSKILRQRGTANPALLDALDSYSRETEADRKTYLESLLKRTPAEIAEEESLVIEARRFELAAKKMLVERAHLLTLLDSPQSSQLVQQHQLSQGLTNLYNNLMILDKHQKKKLHQRAQSQLDPVPPPIPQVASSSHKRDRNFQTHLQQYLAGVLKQLSQPKGEVSPIQQLLAKRLTAKEEEAYGLFYHVNERLTPNVILRSQQRLPGLQQRQSVFKAVNSMLQELDIPTSGGTTWKPNMPTRKTMAKYDELVKAVVALLEVKKGKDKLEAEIELIKSLKGMLLQPPS